MKKVGIIRRAGAAFLMLLFLAGFSCALDMNPGMYALPNTNDLKQDVSGEGYVMVYQNVNTNNLSLNNYLHGSGTIKMASLMNSKQCFTRYSEMIKSNGLSYYGYMLPEYGYGIADDSSITSTEQNEMSYKPETFGMVTGWYAEHPMVFKSALKEKTDAKNYQAGVAMEHQIEYARAMKKDVGVTLNCTGASLGISHLSDGVGMANMKIEEDVTEGNVHIGEILTKTQPGTDLLSYYSSSKISKGSQRKDLVTVDENYWGTFHIEKNMQVNVPKYYIYESSDWLPCICKGFPDMSTWELRVKKSFADIFDINK